MCVCVLHYAFLWSAKSPFVQIDAWQKCTQKHELNKLLINLNKVSELWVEHNPATSSNSNGWTAEEGRHLNAGSHQNGMFVQWRQKEQSLWSYFWNLLKTEYENLYCLDMRHIQTENANTKLETNFTWRLPTCLRSVSTWHIVSY